MEVPIVRGTFTKRAEGVTRTYYQQIRMGGQWDLSRIVLAGVILLVEENLCKILARGWKGYFLLPLPNDRQFRNAMGKAEKV